MPLIEDLKPGKNTLVWAYGLHNVAGLLLYRDGQKMRVALGDGEWAGIDVLEFKGEPLDINNPAVVRFYPGKLSAGMDDPIQGSCSIFGTAVTPNIPYSGTAHVSVNVPSEIGTVGEEPDALIGQYRCRVSRDFNANGAQIGVGYSVNLARCAVDMLIERGFPSSRIDWPAYVAFRDFCGVVQNWTDEEGTARTNLRFECHAAFPTPTTIVEALEFLMLLSCSDYQDTGEKIVFLSPERRDSVHDFLFGENMDELRDVSAGRGARPAYLRAEYFDINKEFLPKTDWMVYSQREVEVADIVDQTPQLNLGSTTTSQASRVLQFQLRLKGDLDEQWEFVGLGDSLHVLPADVVRLFAPEYGLAGGEYIVIAATDESAEDTPDLRRFTVQKYDPDAYLDFFVSPNGNQAQYPAPSNLTATLNGNAVTLEWVRNATDNLAVELYQNDAFLEEFNAATTTATVTLSENGTFTFKVRNQFNGAVSGWSNTATVSVGGSGGTGGGGGGFGGGGGGFGGGGFEEWQGGLVN